MNKELNIFHSIELNNYQEVKAYINNGGDVNAVSECDGNSLIMASLHSLPRSKTRIMKLLLKNGAIMPRLRDVFKSNILPCSRTWDFIYYYESLCK